MLQSLHSSQQYTQQLQDCFWKRYSINKRSGMKQAGWQFSISKMKFRNPKWGGEWKILNHKYSWTERCFVTASWEVEEALGWHLLHQSRSTGACRKSEGAHFLITVRGKEAICVEKEDFVRKGLKEGQDFLTASLSTQLSGMCHGQSMTLF